MALPAQRLRDVLTRVDELLALLLKVEREQLKLLQLISERIAPPPPPIAPAITERIIERHEAGVSVTEIAREFHTTESIVREVIERVEVERIVAVPTAVTRVYIRTESIRELAAELSGRILQLPNRLKRITWDTSITTWKSMRAEKKIKPAKALGFWVEDIGGGFEYQIVRQGVESDEKTAGVDDKWDQEFDDLLVKGAGGPKQEAYIWYWWRVD